MGNRNVPKIDGEDIHLFQKINCHGFVDMFYIYKFYKTNCKKRTVAERIKQLARHNYLVEWHTFIPPEYSSSGLSAYKIIGLGGKALKLLEGWEELHDYSNVMKTSSPYRMYHQAQLSMSCDSIEEKYKNNYASNFEVSEILNEKMSNLESTQNMPDATIVFKKKNNESGNVLVFIELERSYAREETLSNKLRSYYLSIVNNEYERAWNIGVTQYRILYIAQTNGQYNTLLKKLSALPEKQHLNILVAKYCDVVNHADGSVYYDLNGQQSIKLLGKM